MLDAAPPLPIDSDGKESVFRFSMGGKGGMLLTMIPEEVEAAFRMIPQ